MSPQSSASAEVDICICTFRRPSLTDTLLSLQHQAGFAGRFRIIVADNDETPSARDQIDRFQSAADIDLTYLHAPARNISIARNACLEAATAELVAFIDDDEVADPTWLSSLCSALEASGADAVFGPVEAIYSDDAPTWIQAANLHSTRPVETPRGVDTGYTSNALVRRSAISDLRFDVALGRSGGEDTDLFTRLHDRGRRFAPAPAAIVRERVAANRLSLHWLASRSFRSGQTHARRFLTSPARRASAGAVTMGKAVACGALALSQLGSPTGWRRAVVRGALHLGATARLLGLRDRQLY